MWTLIVAIFTLWSAYGVLAAALSIVGTLLFGVPLVIYARWYQNSLARRRGAP